MSFVRKSKYRHVFGQIAKAENQYTGMLDSPSGLDTNCISVNGKYIAYIVQGSGGGTVGCFPMTQVGRHTAPPPTITGHTRPVTDIDFNPFDSEIIATGAEDCAVRVFKIPATGIPAEGLSEPVMKIAPFGQKVRQVSWNPAASNVLGASGADKVFKVIDAAAGAELFTLPTFKDDIQDFKWNQTGNYIGTVCRDKMLRIFDVRSNQAVIETQNHKGAKTGKLVFDNTRNWFISVGFGVGSNRELMIWDMKNASTPLFKTVIDQAGAVMTPFFDEATQILFITGKGEANIRYYELTDEKPHCFYISTAAEGNPQRGIAAIPKRYVNTKACEIMRFYRLTAKNSIEPISMIVPRRSEMFQDDIYPPVVDHCTASMTVDEWKSGKNTPQRYFVFNAEGTEQYTDAPKQGELKIAPVASAAASSTSNASEVASLKARIAELEAENAKLKKQVADDAQTIKDLREAIDNQ